MSAAVVGGGGGAGDGKGVMPGRRGSEVDKYCAITYLIEYANGYGCVWENLLQASGGLSQVQNSAFDVQMDSGGGGM